jgi:hypothetical protein
MAGTFEGGNGPSGSLGAGNVLTSFSLLSPYSGARSHIGFTGLIT